MGEICINEEIKHIGIDGLKELLIKRGCPKNQTESKLLMVIVDILTNSNGVLLNAMEDAGKERQKADRLRIDNHYNQARKEQLEKEIIDLNHELDGIEKRIERKINEANEKLEQSYKNAKDYIEEFYKSLIDCESQEGRDRARLAQIFVNRTCIETKYDNTAFIIGLAGILSGSAIAPIEELKKINPKLAHNEIIASFGRERETENMCSLHLNDLERIR